MKVNCSNCYNKIDLKKDRYVLLRTNDGEKTLEETYYHFECWKHHFKQCVSNKVGEMSNIVMKGVKRVLGGDFDVSERFNKM